MKNSENGMPRLSIFFVRPRDAQKEYATLFTRIHTRKIDALISTKMQVSVAEWNSALTSEAAWLQHQKAYYVLHSKLNQIEGTIKVQLARPNFNKEELEEAIRFISEPEKVEAERKAREMAEALARKKEQEAAERAERRRAAIAKKRQEERLSKELIWTYLNHFVQEIIIGERKIGADDYAFNTCKSWKAYINVYDNFDPDHIYKWNDIDRSFIARYINFLDQRGYMAKVVNKHLVHLKALINAAYTDGIHSNNRAASLIVKRRIEDQDKAVEIYLTNNELQALFDTHLDGMREKVRDVFLIGCYTCQRVSDYNSLNADCFRTTRKGTRVLNLIQKKTKTEVTVPILSDNLTFLCEKYGYNIPSVNEQVLNRYIKQILKDLSETVPSLAEKVPTRLTMKQKAALKKAGQEPEVNQNGFAVLPRYACVSSHTARRTGITNMYLTHKYTLVQMMHVSGHKTPKTFLDYIKLSSEEIADEIAEIAKTDRELF